MEFERKIVAGILMGGIVVVFAIISVMVTLTGRNHYFVKKKLEIGALLLSLSAIMSGCKDLSPGGAVCYVQAIEENVSIDGIRNGQIILNRNVTDTIHCNITESISSKYSIMILDSVNTVLQKETVYSDLSWKFLDSINFVIVCNKTIPEGSYSIQLYYQDADSVKNTDYFAYKYSLKIIN